MAIKLPLTNLQNGILFEVSKFKKQNYYINQEQLRFSTALNISVMRQAFMQLIARYEVLRASVIFESYQPKLVIREQVNLPLKFFDYSNFSNDKASNLFTSFLQKDLTEPIDLTTSPLMRISIFKLAADDYRIVWDIHHIILDGSSISRIIEELFAIYSALLSDKPYTAVPPLPYYKIYDYKAKLSINTAKKYWKQILSNHEIAAFIPCENKNSLDLGTRGRITASVDNNDYQKLVKFSNANSLTINTLFQAAWAIALYHYSNNENVVFGAVRAYPRDVIKNAAGLFINTLPMSFNIDGNTAIIDYLHRVRAQSKKLRDYVTVSLNQIREWGGLTSNTQIFQSVINYEPSSLNSTLKSRFPEIHCNFSSKLNVPYALILEIINESESLTLDLIYNEGMFDSEYMEDFLSHYKVILLQIIANPDKKIVALPIVDSVVYHKVIHEWNDTAVAYPLDKTVHQLFVEQVEKNPNATAVICNGDVLSYKSLNEQANSLSHYLLQQNILSEDPVVILLKPRFEMLISILAVLKAGGVYVPIDVNNPPERIKLILQDSEPKVVITETTYIDKLAAFIKSLPFTKLLVIDVDKPLWHNYPKTNPLVHVTPANLMYIIYTSGSTGQPKGVLIEHFSAVNMIMSCSEKLKVTSKSRILQIASFSFDVSVAEWCMALINGASLYLIEKDIFSPQTIAGVLKQHKITTIILAHSILESLPEVDLPNLKVIAPGGEPLSHHTLTYWAKNRLLLNIYGITETTVCSTMAKCTDKKGIITVGKPLANVQVYVLNKHLQPLPPWVIGEIHIGGYGVGRGYLKQPSLTQEKFIDNPYKNNSMQLPGKKNRLYKTGDLGRWTSDGEIEFIGRLDDQIKIRGLRVETSEIEYILTQYPEIKQAIVLEKKLEAHKQLVAYILPKTTAVIDMAKLQAYIGDHLPSYMIPAQIIQIDGLPLTTHGKIDKKKLLSTYNYIIPELSLKVRPITCKTKEKICAIIRNMLHRQNVLTNVNFLDIGLDSIMLVELTAKLSHEFNQDIDVTTLFTYTTIDALTAFIRNNKNNSFESIKEFVHKRKKH